VWLKTPKIHGRNPGKNKSGPPPKSGTIGAPFWTIKIY